VRSGARKKSKRKKQIAKLQSKMQKREETGEKALKYWLLYDNLWQQGGVATLFRRAYGKLNYIENERMKVNEVEY